MRCALSFDDCASAASAGPVALPPANDLTSDDIGGVSDSPLRAADATNTPSLRMIADHKLPLTGPRNQERPMNIQPFALNRRLINNAFGFVVLAAFLWGLSQFNAAPDVPQVGVPELIAQRAEGNGPVIIDVRGAESWGKGHIDNARRIPLAELDARINELPADKSQRVVVYCGDGSKLGPAGTAKLQSMGYGKVANLSGGIEAWRAAGQKVVAGNT